MADLLLDGKIRDIPRWYEGKYSKSRLVPEAYEATDYFPSLGAGKWMRFTAATIRDSIGQIIGTLETLEDITDRKRGEIALQKAYDELEGRVEERTRDLLQSSEALKAEVAERKNVEKKLRRQERELKIKSHNLGEMNTALKVLLEQRDRDKREAEEVVIGNVKELLSPYIEKLKKTKLSDMQAANLGIIESNLENIISPFLKNIHGKHCNMTPKEIRIASLIKEGRTTKEIAFLLGMSCPAVEFHRNNIRKKLGLKHIKANLASHLAAIVED
jgi:DNA-binding CsgD family transcriptional regulator